MKIKQKHKNIHAKNIHENAKNKQNEKQNKT